MTSNLKPEIHIALVHYPVVNKEGKIVATAVTNLDIHDNARSARTFGVKSFHIITPLDAQIELVTRILDHWRNGFGARRVPSRAEAMSLIEVKRSLEETVQTIKDTSGLKPFIIATCARRREQTMSYKIAKEMVLKEKGPFLLVFGTGYGLAEEVFEMSDAVLASIGDPSDWNHLSVRSAVAITLDRLLGPSVW